VQPRRARAGRRGFERVLGDGGQHPGHCRHAGPGASARGFVGLFPGPGGIALFIAGVGTANIMVIAVVVPPVGLAAGLGATFARRDSGTS
jgi:hypothetical protein